MQPITIYKGPGRWGSDIIVTATLGGNSGTGKVVDLTIATLDVADAVDAFDGPGGQRGGAYVRAGDALGWQGACGGCPMQHKASKSPCYVQRNARSGGQPAKQIATRTDPGTDNARREAWRSLLAMAMLSGHRRVRSAVAGDMGAVPRDVWTWISGAVSAAGASWLGYTHAWRKRGSYDAAPWLRGSHMASTNSPAETDAARASGWGTFEVRSVYVFEGGVTLDSATLCPKSAEAKRVHGAPVTCDACGLCDGAQRAIVVPSHGGGDAARKRGQRMKGATIRNASGVIVGRF